MFFLKKVLLGLFFVFIVTLGGAGTQSNSLLMQGMGFVGILVGLVIIYVFWRMIWKGLGCLPSFLIISAITLFMMYALGMFNNGLGGIGQAIEQFLGYREETQDANTNEQETKARLQFSEDFQDQEELQPEPDQEVETLEESDEDFDPSSLTPNLFDEEEKPELSKKAKSQSRPKKGVFESAIQSMTGNKKSTQNENRPFNPNDYPAVYGSVRVISGNVLEMYGRTLYIFGIDAPELNQTCADRQGRSYKCGSYAANWLKNWIQDNELECHIIKQDTKGNVLGTCAFGPYDIGAALVNAGWAVANTQQSDIYVAYELQAQADRRGLWQGSFYKPWDWRKLQKRKPKIKVLRPQKKKIGIFG